MYYSDVLNRHYQSCPPAQQSGKPSIKIFQPVNRACSSCRRSKVRCSGSRPCDRCCSLGRGDLCQFTVRKSRQANGTSEYPTQNQDVTLPAEECLLPYQASTNRDDTNGAIAALNVSDTTVQAVDQQIEIGSVLRQSQEPLGQDVMNEPDIGAAVELELDQATLATLTTNSLTDSGLSDGTADLLDFSDIGPGMSFDLDPLDWGLLDNSLMTYQEDGQNTIATTSSSPDQISSWNTSMGHMDDTKAGVRKGVANLKLPTGIDMMQISPMESHRMRILQYLEHFEPDTRRWESWLTLDNMSLFICSYFSFFHQHTPLLHLPTWNVTTTSTPLIFSIVLMGSMYSGNLKSHSSNARQLCHLAQSFPWESDPGLGTDGQAQLDTIQAVYIAVLLEAFYFPPRRHPPGVSISRLVDEARKSGVFRSLGARTDSRKSKWKEWSAQECQTRSVANRLKVRKLGSYLPTDVLSELHSSCTYLMRSRRSFSTDVPSYSCTSLICPCPVTRQFFLRLPKMNGMKNI